MTTATEKPLFIPLKREFFEAFQRGEKTEEYRLAGGRWNDRTCRPGRPVVLSLGYGKAHRLRGVVRCFYESWEPCKREAWRGIYGDQGPAAVIGVEIQEIES